MKNPNSQTATLAGGSFWCTEAIFKTVKGVGNVTSGYCGGVTSNPTYESVCSGITGHAEAVQIEFDSIIISYKEILRIFFATHDPTTLNRQGNDVGTQYRSVIFYHDQYQKNAAQEVIKNLENEGIFESPIVTEITPYNVFYPAEDYHKDYFEKNSSQVYCQVIINPKLIKFRQEYKEKLK